MNKILKTMLGILLIGGVLCNGTLIASAEMTDPTSPDYIDPSCYTPYTGWEENSSIEFEPKYYEFTHEIRTGGINKIDGVQCESKEDCFALEEELRRSGYVLVSTKDKEITDEEFDILFNGTYNLPYSDRVKPNSPLYWTLYKLYIYEPTLEMALEQLSESRRVNLATQMELSNSVVGIDYNVWRQVERVGKVIDEYNDNISSWKLSDAGFLQIESPVHAKIVLQSIYEHTIYEFYVKAHTPFLVKINGSGYKVTAINEQGISDWENALVYDNTIHVHYQHTEEEPYILSLEEVVAKYEIPSMDISGMPDYSWESKDKSKEEMVFAPVDMTVESTEVFPDEPSAVKESDNTILMWIVIAVCVVILIAVLWYIKKNEKEN